MAKAETGTVASVDDTEQTAPVSKEKNIRAKLGRLNSLQRNVNAYMNSKSKKFAAAQAFAVASANAQNAQAAADKAAAAVVDAQAQLDALNAQLDTLNGLTPDQIAAMTPEEQAALPGQIADLEAQVAAQETTVSDAEAAAAAAQTAADQAAVGTDDASLDAALADMANKPVDAEVTDWAKGVLADKIDQVAAKQAPAP
ncbi:MAG: hypothetical protein EOQ86_30195 [Mesorhizobium sp.]|nr:MAG: hypothetical protein EOQ85_32780 [Mesorhizobium sp.]RWH76334.1 MAG: hypothetical protein EOQ86_30195 [Mesorhizobium sp.]RWH83536.1 MAG: hypothetical protein EOQ87_32805 [Mesorhizobium sp.]RWH91553.1 MAG: hypothetical protein EOQ88_31820 [Mesorhizobium sp.]RWH95825.1 MAG: hypothetical protein EOQ89_30475 [Mesorhizobium sp.]